MIPIVTPAEMAAIDAAATVPVDVLIERAGAAVAREAVAVLGGTYGRRAVVLAGKGNNGRDGIVAARLLRRRGVRVTVVDAAAEKSVLPHADLVIDAAYGTGFRGSFHAPRCHEPETPVLAVDIVSGLSGLTGAVSGESYRAVSTVTFAALKPGLVLGDGPALSGRVTVADIGLDVSESDCGVVTASDVSGWLPRRARTDHKWRHAVCVVAGSPGMTGAAQLCSRAAMRAGAGYVRLSTPGTGPTSEGAVEVVSRSLPSDGWADMILDDLERFGAVAVGPGLGTDPSNAAQVRRLAGSADRIVIDGDGLRALGDSPQETLAARPHHLSLPVLTPHEGEFIGLGGDLDPTHPGAGRLDAVRDLARRARAIVLLKGAVTVVAHPDGRTRLVTNGDQRLATAGTGDVLSGIIAALLGSGAPPLEAATAGAWVHAAAAKLGPRIGLIASDLPDTIPTVLERLAARRFDELG